MRAKNERIFYILRPSIGGKPTAGVAAPQEYEGICWDGISY